MKKNTKSTPNIASQPSCYPYEHSSSVLPPTKETTMSYEQFLQKINESGISWDEQSQYCKGKEAAKNQEKISVRWSTGGMSGGGWRDTDAATAFVSDDPPEELTQFDSILEIFCPDISFLKYKNIQNKCVTTGSHRSNDYYGNHTNYITKECKLFDLYTELLGRNLIS